MRLEAQKKKGFYPLPSRVSRMISRKIIADPSATIFDPCAGEGDAVANIAGFCGIPEANIYACELDSIRSETLAKRLPEAKVFKRVDFLGAFHNGGASISYVNPPFDNELGGGGREEWKFIDRAIGCTAIGGLVVIVIPERVFTTYNTARILASKLDRVSFFHPPEEVRDFGEVVVFGVKRESEVSNQSLYGMKPDYASVPCYEVGSGESVNVRKVTYTEEEFSEISETTTASELLKGSASKQRSSVVCPPMSMRAGHRAMLLASGYLDGVVETGDGDRHVVRGSSVKKIKKREEDDGTSIKCIETEVIYLVVKALTQGGEIVLLTDSMEGAKEEEEEEEVEDVDAASSVLAGR